MLEQAIDYTGAVIILVSLFLGFKRRWHWGLYLVGCLLYVWLNWENGLMGQAVMNAVAGLLAVRQVNKGFTKEYDKRTPQ
jgi:hypothetical protein